MPAKNSIYPEKPFTSYQEAVDFYKPLFSPHEEVDSFESLSSLVKGLYAHQCKTIDRNTMICYEKRKDGMERLFLHYKGGEFSIDFFRDYIIVAGNIYNATVSRLERLVPVSCIKFGSVWLVKDPNVFTTFDKDDAIFDRDFRIHYPQLERLTALEWDGTTSNPVPWVPPRSRKREEEIAFWKKKIKRWLDWFEFHVRNGNSVYDHWDSSGEIVGSSSDLRLNGTSSEESIKELIAKRVHIYSRGTVSLMRTCNVPINDEGFYHPPPNHKTTMKEFSLFRTRFMDKVLNRLVP